nr:beta-ketoacyl-[acyl-carrier-protein] synthase family protein [uncultured Desulfobacter sp.]
MADRQRVFITGVGVISAIGNGFDMFRDALKAGRNGVGRIRAFDPGGLACQNGCEVDDLTSCFPEEDARPMDRASQLAMIAADQAVQTSGLVRESGSQEIGSRTGRLGIDPTRSGIALGGTIGGMASGFAYYRRLKNGQAAPGFLLDQPLYSMGARISAAYGLQGPNLVFSTACSSANIAIGYACDLIRSGRMDIMLAGGVDPMAEITCAGFGVLRNTSPDVARPFDRKRNGLILGEGAGILLLESEKHFRQRQGHIYGEVLGYGMSSDAYHMTSPDVLGRGAARSMYNAVSDSGLVPGQVEYINAHGTATKHNDQMETMAIKKVFEKRAYDIPVSSTKSMHGHTLGAAGGIEAIAVLAAMDGGFIPPTMNYREKDPKCDLDYVPNQAREQQFSVGLSNNFGFGGNNCTVILGRGPGQ